MTETGTDIEKARHFLASGSLVAIPTETVYGLAGNALDSATAAKIFNVKGRPFFDPLIVHIPSPESAMRYARSFPEQAKILAANFWPGPLTLVVEKKEIIPDIVTSGMNTVGLRCPDHPMSLSLLQKLDFPLAAPSANPFGYISPTTAAHVNDQLGDKIPYILDGGPCRVGVESTIVGFEEDHPVIYRLGGVTREAIERCIGPVDVATNSTSHPVAPGQLKSHYAPAIPLVLGAPGSIPRMLKHHDITKAGILSFRNTFKEVDSEYQIVLSPSGNLEEAAQNLFVGLRKLDKMNIAIILAEEVPDTGLGKAINDRLRRAAATEH